MCVVFVDHLCVVFVDHFPVSVECVTDCPLCAVYVDDFPLSLYCMTDCALCADRRRCRGSSRTHAATRVGSNHLFRFPWFAL